MPTNGIEARVEAHHKVTFSDNIAMVAQQKKARTRMAVTEVAVSGEMVAVDDRVGTADPIRVDDRDRRNHDLVAKNTRRWLQRPNKLKWGRYIDDVEKLDRAMDPTGYYTQTGMASVNRGIDEVILGVQKNAAGVYEVTDGGILGGALNGKRGTDKSELPATCYTAAGGEGLTLPKLIAANERLQSDEFGIDEDDQMFAMIAPRDVSSLLNIALATNASLNAFDIEQLKSGKPTGLMGMTWIVSNMQPKTAAGEGMIPCWTKGNIMLGVWQDIRGRMWNDTASDDTPYCCVDFRGDCTRAQDLGVQIILTAA